jgi:hypothetical protein
VQRRTQLLFQLVAPRDHALCFGLGDGEAVLSGGLGLVQRHVGVAQQLAGRGGRPDRDADTGGDPDGRVASGNVERLSCATRRLVVFPA